MMKVYQAINKVQAALAVEGIGKDRKNEAQGYKFRGIDDVYNALAPLLAKNGLCILPRFTERSVTERVTVKEYKGERKETALFYVTVRGEFDFVCSEDGSKHTVTSFGEAMDTGDKATNKAMSAAYKYACMQAFSIPTEGDNDADAHTHEVKAAPKIAPVAVSSKDLDADPVKVAKAVAELVELHEEETQGTFKRDYDYDYAYFETVEPLTQDERLAVWNALAGQSKVRSRIKKAQEAIKAREPKAAE